VLDIEINEIEQAGVEIKTNTPVQSVDMLQEQGYHAVLVAIGTHKGEIVPIPGANNKMVRIGIDFLKETHLGDRPDIKCYLVYPEISFYIQTKYYGIKQW
jgi:NADPH-dependent glutamate synthase beta subunit-like oxidoreductase